MRGFYEKLGVLGPIYRLVGEGFSDREIAGRLRLSEPVVTNCIAWMLHSLKFAGRSWREARPARRNNRVRAHNSESCLEPGEGFQRHFGGVLWQQERCWASSSFARS